VSLFFYILNNVECTYDTSNTACSGNNRQLKAEQKASSKQNLLPQLISRKQNPIYTGMCRVLMAADVN